MSRVRRVLVTAAGVLAVFAAAPLVAAEGLYGFALHELGTPPATPAPGFTSEAVSAFWLGAGERLPLVIEPLSPWRYGWALAYDQDALTQRHPGDRIAVLAARAWVGDRAPPRGPKRALLSWAAMVWASHHWDAAQMTQVWMHGAWFGRNARGLEAASSAYFGKAPGDLAVGDIALLAALTRSPSWLRPECTPERATNARNRVLREMLDAGILTDARTRGDERRPAAPGVP